MAVSIDNAELDLPTFPNDKIVGLYRGSFNAATDTTIITYTLNGSPYNVWWYKIPHSFGMPVFCDLMTSTDNVTFSLSNSISYSDSSAIYIYAGQGSAPSGIVYYKLVASWIDNYMATAPFINTGTPDPGSPAIDPVLTNQVVAFDSRFNYRKVTASGVSAQYSGNNGSVTLSQSSVGNPSLPIVKVYMECLQNQVWTCHSGGTSDLYLFDDTMQTGSYYWDSSPATVDLSFNLNPNANGWSAKPIGFQGSQGTTRFWYKVLS